MSNSAPLDIRAGPGEAAGVLDGVDNANAAILWSMGRSMIYMLHSNVQTVAPTTSDVCSLPLLITCCTSGRSLAVNP